MRVVIIVLVVVAVGFAVVALWGGMRTGSASDNCAPPPSGNGEITEDSLDGWHPCNTTAWLGKVTAPFAPKLKLARPQIVLAAGGTDSRVIAAYHPWIGSDMRVAHIAMQSAGGVLVQYHCPFKAGRTCSDPVCICAEGSRFTALQIGACRASWRARHILAGICRAQSAETSFPIYPEAGGTLGFAALGGTGAIVSVK